MPNDYELRREYVLDQAITAGKFGPARRAFWATQYDRDPARTEQTLAALAAAPDGESPYPRELFPELARSRGGRDRTPTHAAAAPARPLPSTDVVDAQVAAWSRELFPETVVTGASNGRVTRCND